MGKRLAKKVLLIGWDAADWKVINPLLDSGQMPALEKLINGGVIGNLATLDPPLSPMLWTSIASGKRPYKHGILGFTEPDPNGNGIRPILGSSRKVKAIWNILTQHGLKTHVVGWWPSHPADPINGVCISNFYSKAQAPIEDPWIMAKGTVHPESKSEFFAKLRIHPGELTASHLLPFVPGAEKVDQDKDKRLVSLAKIIAESATIQAAGTYILENEEWDFTGIYFDAIDHFCHGFMKFHPPKMDHVPEELFELYNEVVNGGYRFHDMMLERLVQLAGPDTTIILMSDHGFHSDHLRPERIPKEPAGPALEHSPYGIICINGPGIKKDERIYGASILDITPTILAMFGLPVAEDMDGKALVSAFSESVNPDKITSWEDIPGDCGMLPGDFKEDPAANEQTLQQLVDLGYIEEPDEDKEKAVRKTVNENTYYLARSFMDARKYTDATPLLERLFEENPDAPRYGVRLAICYQNLNNFEKLKSVVEKLKGTDESYKSSALITLLEGSVLLGENKFKDAVELFNKAHELSPKLPFVNLQIGRSFFFMKKWKEAEEAFQRVLEADYENAAAHHLLGLTFLREGDFEKAIEALLNAIGLTYYFPFAHYHLAEAFFYSGNYHRAAEAFEVCLRLAPNLNKARQWLVKIYNDFLDEPEKAAFYASALEDNLKGTITVVSGLPRSGTSMMMQMLEKGGLEIFTDKKRIADENNPKGYYEHEAVKRLSKDKTWLKEANGKVLKIISHLLIHLPANFHYKVIFMERDIYEVMISQQKMLARDGKIKKDTTHLSLKTAFEQNLRKVKDWQAANSHVEMLYVNHADVINDPVGQAKKISSFLEQDLNVNLMASVVDKSLHRERIQEISK